ncbi:hypothetical protein [Streptococcus pseudopneumoniae]|uniref:hypothetical protein n=1 Tax=Streptococcus pseudopneumoniae TaxID=257758 RepID=UPI0014199904|nr:hypothetical protein [Streptococcus pseudopneumoniae]MBF9605663.1 hypothetical protein [Streptococcus pseudopneumoniae]NIB93516.1 hypothetical protein [Streptococcus pseudopneumoniae]
MEEMKREFAGKLYRKTCEIAEFYEEQMDSEDEDEVFDIEECLVELCQLVFDEMIFCQAAVSRTYFATLPTDNLYIMSEARKELPFKPQQEVID